MTVQHASLFVAYKIWAEFLSRKGVDFPRLSDSELISLPTRLLRIEVRKLHDIIVAL